MDTRFLESFTTVVESGSLAEAARRLNLTPAALAQRIRALERELGVHLLARTGRTVKPTEAGAAILPRSRLFLREVRDLRALAAGEDIAGELRLGAISSALTGILPDVLQGLSTRYENLDLYVVPGTSKNLYADILGGDIDAAVVVEPPFPLPKTCGWQMFREEPLVLITPAAMERTEVKDILRREPFIRYDRNHWGGRYSDAYLRKLRIRPKERFELDALDAIAVLVDRGLGVSLVPDWSPPWPEGLALNKLRLPGSVLGRRIGLIWLRNSPRSRLIRAFVDEVRRTGWGDGTR
ncbi:LysR family transcriptional regulator [Bosea sp. (in: a-proteobacteria)]|uniref:LysR family transcriptional regulator n=1 Tax=Bosea sp. (in: a-proteobacteria) TaxID=1871050 RepID=UPI0026384265|nr:LysR family transcriptional regulator [Bosea sp. (in: a-proteobacteria)]MCO5089764.1 LysR family transcriptional regulator [Bosea sp. (in: a-proteobacteria)]